HLGKNHKISDLFRHLKVGQIECRKRRILVGRVKLYISALQLENNYYDIISMSYLFLSCTEIILSKLLSFKLIYKSK
ncbi:hypothetical protein CKN53_16355, partial [Acinetobacter baumannii]